MSKEKQPTPPTPSNEPTGPVTKFHVEMEFDIATSRLQVKSKAPTVILSGILKLAEQAPPALLKEEGTLRRVLIDYDATTDAIQVATDATDLVLRGIFVMAYSMMTTNQVLQHVNAMQAKARIIRPGAERVS